MLNKLTSTVILAFSVGVFLPLAAGAGTFKGTTHSRAEAVSMGGAFDFADSDKFSTAELVTGSNTVVFSTNPSLGGAFTFQGVREVNLGGTPCTFTGIFGASETGVNSALVGSAYAADGPSGSIFEEGASGTGCDDLATGEFTFTETDTISEGMGLYKGATGHVTYTEVGFTLAPPPGGLGFFEWSRSNGTIKINLP